MSSTPSFSDQDPSHPLYGFKINHWVEQPVKTGPDWFQPEERYRRNANEHVYKQHGTHTNWYRYIMLGFFTFDDCLECDKVWNAMETAPLHVHRSIWYNFMYHVDRDLVVPEKLNAWATDITLPYLTEFDPTTLHGTDTLKHKWKEMPFMQEMEIDKTEEWIPVQPNRRRSKSPPTATSETQINPRDNIVDKIHDENSSFTVNPKSPAIPTGYNHPNQGSGDSSASSTQNSAPFVTRQKSNYGETTMISTGSTEVSGMERLQEHHKHKTGSWNGRAEISKPPPYPTIPTNDGTHRVNIKWKPPEDISVYEQDKCKLNECIYNLVHEMFPAEVGLFYRWESEDLVISKVVQNMTATELRDFISPKVTLVSTSAQMIFGLRVGFTQSPVRWRKSEHMQSVFKRHKLEVLISNSQSASGKMVTAGYILLKAPNTTNVNRYTQYLRSLLPKSVPYFDI